MGLNIVVLGLDCKLRPQGFASLLFENPNAHPDLDLGKHRTLFTTYLLSPHFYRFDKRFKVLLVHRNVVHNACRQLFSRLLKFLIFPFESCFLTHRVKCNLHSGRCGGARPPTECFECERSLNVASH